MPQMKTLFTKSDLSLDFDFMDEAKEGENFDVKKCLELVIDDAESETPKIQLEFVADLIEGLSSGLEAEEKSLASKRSSV